MSQSFWKKAGPIISAFLVVFISFYGGLAVGKGSILRQQIPTGITNPSTGQPSNVDFSEFWQAWNILNQKYAGSDKNPNISDQDKVYGAIKGLAESYGDPYTTFFPPVEAKEFQTQISGNFQGVGMEVGKRNDVLTVVAPLKDSPAERAGIKAGDIILQINGTTTANLSSDQAVALIRGPKGTTVTITIAREGDTAPREIKIVRDVINIPTIKTESRDDGVFIISLYTFTADSANLFRNALREFVQSGDDKLILDLRGNPGGYLDAAVDMASWFLPSNAVIVKEDTNGHGQDQVFNSKGYDVFGDNLKMVILVDGGSASASEILSGALQEHGVAKLVGETTFGKGSVQELVPLNSETSLKITVARWLTPNGKSISEQGLEPDIKVPVTQADIDKKVDPQLQAALKELLGK